MAKYIYICFLIVILTGCADEESAKIRQQDGSISLRDFFRNPEKSSVKISPDGNYISYLAPYKTRLNIFVRKIGSDSAYRITSEADRDILLYIWAGSNRILYLKDNMGDENYKLYSVKIDGGAITTLIDLEKVNAMILDEELYDGNEVLILLNKRNQAVYDFFRINIETGRLKLVFQNPGTFQKFLSDHNGKIRLAFGADGPNSALYYRGNESEPFKKILSVSYNDIFIPIMFSPDNKRIIASSNIGLDKQAIIELNPADITNNKILYGNHDYDVPYLIYFRKKKNIIAYQFTYWKTEYHMLEPQFGAMLKKIYSNQ